MHFSAHQHTLFSRDDSVRSVLRERFQQIPAATALLAPGGTGLTYGQLEARVDANAARLNGLGLGPNDRIALLFPNALEMALAFFSVAATATAAPLNPAYRSRELDIYLSEIEVKALWVQSGIDSPAREVAAKRGLRIIDFEPLTDSGDDGSRLAPLPGSSQPDDVALLLATSGSTGEPKIVPLTQANICASARNIARTLKLGQADRCLNIMPLFHVHGLIGALLSSLAAGGGVVLTPGVDPRMFLSWLAEFGATWYTAAPTLHQAILEEARKQERETVPSHRLRFIRSSSAPLSRKIATELEKVFGVPVIESYGMTEASHQIASNPLPPGTRKLGSVGYAAGAEVTVLDGSGRPVPSNETGEIAIRGANVSRSYEDSAGTHGEAFRDGWFCTGDEGFLDSEGYLFITGRLKEMINRGGEKIAPREVDEALLDHPAVAQAVSFPLPHRRLGEDVGAVVVLHRDSTVEAGALQRFVSGRLADFKIPSRIFVLDRIPLGATGKVEWLGLARDLGLSTQKDAWSNAGKSAVFSRLYEEEVLARIWASVMKLDEVGIHDNFFQLGGDSIYAAQIASRVRQALEVELSFLSFFEAPTVSEMARNLRRELPYSPIPPSTIVSAAPHGEAFPLTYAQEGMWVHAQLNPESLAHHRPGAFFLEGRLNVPALERALEEIVQRHETLRTTFPEVDGRPSAVAVPRPVSLPLIDLGELPAVEREGEAYRVAFEEARRPFDFRRGPLFRWSLLRLGKEAHVLLSTLHHIVSDAWSSGVLRRELAALYGAFADGRPSPLSPLPIQYRDFARWQRQAIKQDFFREQVSYWKQRLAGAPPLLELRTDRPRLANTRDPGARYECALPVAVADSLRAVGRQAEGTLFMTLLAAFFVLLHRYTNENDILLATPVAGRNRLETEELIGLCINTLILRCDLSGNPTFRHLLKQVQTTVTDAFLRQDVPFEMLSEEFSLRRASPGPILPILFQLRRPAKPLEGVQGLAIRDFEFQNGIARLDLVMEFVDEGRGLSCVIEYNTDLFQRATVERLLGNFQVLLEGVAVDPDCRVGELPLLTEAEKKKLVAVQNELHRKTERGIHESFEARVERSPDSVALVFEGEQLTFSELNRRGNQLARHLQKLGVGAEVPVGVCVERSLEMIIGFLGILKAGGLYVPLDPSHPQERLAFLLRESGASVLLTTVGLTADFSEVSTLQHRVCLDCDWDLVSGNSGDKASAPFLPDGLGYVIYTSGSTGTPKGVEVSHRSVTRLLGTLRPLFPFHESDVWTLFHSCSFDFSVWEMWGPLIYGSRCAVVPSWRTQSPKALHELLDLERVTVLNQTPSAMRALVSEGQPKAQSALRLVICGGEAFPPELVREVSEAKFSVWNLYGPTEATVWSTINGAISVTAANTVPIGRALANTQVYVLDPYGQLVPVGVAGELHIGGPGLARGYQARPEATAEKFVPNPFHGEIGSRLYKTGDLVRYLPEGEIEFLGRIDHQVKIRGFRIELGEIEATLRQHPSVREAAAMLHSDKRGEERIVAYVVAEPEASTKASDWCNFLRQKLPSYMIPSMFVTVDAMPLTASGKIDRKALVPPDRKLEVDPNFVAPSTSLQSFMAGIWQEVLQVDRVGAYDNFFDLGGHSLLAMQVLARIEEATGVRMEPSSLQLQTLGQLASACEERQAAKKTGVAARLFGEIKEIFSRKHTGRGT